MKAIILLITIIQTILACVSMNNPNLYALHTVVIEQLENLTVFEDSEGYTWAAYTDIPVGAECILIMDDNGSEDITDDMIRRILPLESGYDYNGKIELISNCNISAEILENRAGTLVVERMIGRVENLRQDGRILGEKSGHDYISYRYTDMNPGDIVETYLIYDPAGSDVDEITERFDFRLF